MKAASAAADHTSGRSHATLKAVRGETERDECDRRVRRHAPGHGIRHIARIAEEKLVDLEIDVEHMLAKRGESSTTTINAITCVAGLLADVSTPSLQSADPANSSATAVLVRGAPPAAAGFSGRGRRKPNRRAP